MNTSESNSTGDSQSSVRIVSQPESVPVLNCVVYLSKSDRGGVAARVANLQGVEFEADSEREALQITVTRFKELVSQSQADGKPLPLIDPPVPIQPNETRRLIAVHL